MREEQGKPVKIVITVRDGVVEEVYSNYTNIEIKVHDFDETDVEPDLSDTQEVVY
jgi:hypothetical protein